ncbi:MAG: class I SAM-dependent methyltransferase [Thiotrichales bacterium]
MKSGFCAAWLETREVFDALARAPELFDWLRPRWTSAAPLRVLDLGAGTGSNLRYLAPRWGGAQDWTLVDHDPTLLARVPVQLHASAWSSSRHYSVNGLSVSTAPNADPIQVETRHADLVTALAGLPWGRVDLVTASALLDLVSAPWLAALIARCQSARADVLFALSYNGRIDLRPRDPLDSQLREWVNRHQLTDKGFGPALGPGAVAEANALLTASGYEVRQRSSDWVIPSEAYDMQRYLFDGWVAAAIALEPDAASTIEAWRARRETWLDQGVSGIVVGHVDLAARWAGGDA